MQLRVLLVLVCAGSAAAHTNCAHDVATAYRRAAVLRPSKGKAALLEQIQRADIARHEDDEAACLEAVAAATSVLDHIDAARRARPAKQ